MKYRIDEKNGKELSILGFGCMRFPRTLGQIDYKKSEKLILDAVEKGINYFDTAYIYLGSEEILGKIVKQNDLRDKIYIATKLPHYKCKSYEDFDKIFNEQLEHLQTEYIDYFLIHNIGDIKQWENLVGLGIEKWISEKKEKGQVKQIGFSFHGMKNQFPLLIDAYNWDFCQIQYNYLNINYQAGYDGLVYAHSKGLAVIIMEPLLGGKLANKLPQEVSKIFNKVNKNLSPASFALRWLWNQKEVTVVLSGMNEDSQLIENVATANEIEPNSLSQDELDAVESAIKIFNEKYKINCTGCNYCMPCPKNVNIPACFAAYNMYHAIGKVDGFKHYLLGTQMTKKNDRCVASQCVKCKLCEKHCPQNIKISEEMSNVAKTMEPKWFTTILKLFRR